MSNAIPLKVLVQAHAALCAAQAHLKSLESQQAVTTWHTVMGARIDLEYAIAGLAPVAVEVPPTPTESPQ